MIRIAICDDNKYALEKLNKCIHQSFKSREIEHEIVCYINGERLLTDFLYSAFDAVFLDIDMPEIDGFEIARLLNRDKRTCFIIFVTVHAELVFRSFDFQPFHFIRKEPVGALPENIDNVISKFLSCMKQKQIIKITDTDCMSRKIAVENIVYIKSKGHYLEYYMNDKSVIRVRDSISVIDKSYSEYDFIRIHRSIIINMKYIKSANTKFGKIVLSFDNQRIALSMSTTYQSVFEMKYEQYMRSIVW